MPIHDIIECIDKSVYIVHAGYIILSILDDKSWHDEPWVKENMHEATTETIFSKNF